jgi:hypothetical protein
MNPMSLLVMPREVLQQMRPGGGPHPLAAPACGEAAPRGWVDHEVHEFGRMFWAAMLSPPPRRPARRAD